MHYDVLSSETACLSVSVLNNLCADLESVCSEINSLKGQEVSMVCSIICDCWERVTIVALQFSWRLGCVKNLG